MTATDTNPERLEVLLAMAITSLLAQDLKNQQNGENEEEDSAEESSLSERVALNLRSLQEEDLRAVRQKIEFYESLSDEEKRIWHSRTLNRVGAHRVRLDKDIHFTQIAEVLRNEPDYLKRMVLSRLSKKLAEDVADTLQMERTENLIPRDVDENVEQLLRRRFLANFTSRDEIYDLKPLATLSATATLELLQKLGRNEIAIVCRSIKEVERLAPFLRRFEKSDAQAIVEQVAQLKSVERKRIHQAEKIVMEAWHSETDAVLIVQLVGIYKLSVALTKMTDDTVNYILQKLPLSLANDLRARMEYVRADKDASVKDFAEIAESETETLAAQILLDEVRQRG